MKETQVVAVEWPVQQPSTLVSPGIGINKYAVRHAEQHGEHLMGCEENQEGATEE